MRTEALHGAIHKEPFRPFWIHLANGERLLAHHREFILCPPGARTAVLVEPNDACTSSISR